MTTRRAKMEQNQDTLNNISQSEIKYSSAAKKFWKTPELRIMPVPTKTLNGQPFKSKAVENSLYTKS